MRLTKMLGLAAVAAVAAMAFVGPTSASANTSTQLCKVHTGLTCPAGEGTTSVHMVGSGDIEALFWPTVLCLNVLGLATPLGLGNPQEVHTTELNIINCGTNTMHTNCTVAVTSMPLFSLLKTGLDQGVLTDLNGEIDVFCSGILECSLDTSGVTFAVSAQHLTASNDKIVPLAGFCPSEPNLDVLLETLTPTYVLQ